MKGRLILMLVGGVVALGGLPLAYGDQDTPAQEAVPAVPATVPVPQDRDQPLPP